MGGIQEEFAKFKRHHFLANQPITIKTALVYSCLIIICIWLMKNERYFSESTEKRISSLCSGARN